MLASTEWVMVTLGPDDVELVSSVARGDRDALEVLYRRYAPWLVLRLSRRCGDRGVVDEALQDTFVAVWRSAAKFKGKGEPAAWIWGIAIRRLIDCLRRQGRAPEPWAEVVGARVVSVEEEVLRRPGTIWLARPRRQPVPVGPS
ncbi:MAG: RNA polymerase sigma factor [Acidimicrobiales bacterium]